MSTKTASGPELELKTNFSTNCYSLIPTDFYCTSKSFYFSFKLDDGNSAGVEIISRFLC